MIKIKVLFVTLFLVFISGITVNAQTEGSVFNPYTQFGLGDVSRLGTAATRGMGGAGLASREMYSMNLLNPASYTAMNRQNAIFSVGGEGTNNYLSSDGYTNSRNYFNLNHLGFQIRLSNKFGFGFIMAPYSSMGYEISRTDQREEILTSIGNVRYDYVGTGGVSLIKGGLAYSIAKNLNIGVNLIHYVGTLQNDMGTSISSSINLDTYRNLYSFNEKQINLSSFEVGVQYTYKLSELESINFGAVFQPQVLSSMSVWQYTIAGTNVSDTDPSDVIVDEEYDEEFYMPTKIAAGVNYTSPKFVLALDYTYTGWGSAFPNNAIETVDYIDSHEINAGVQYTPNRFDIRSPLKRWSYRAGLSFSNSYIVVNDVKTNNYSLSVGAGIPIEADWFSQLNVSFEGGREGSGASGQLRNNYLKLNLGVVFAARRWFVKFKFD